MGELYSVIYNGVNLNDYKMTSQEKSTVEKFRKELIDICDELDVPRGKCFDGSPYMGRLKDNYEFLMKYKADIGYFALEGERGKYYLYEGLPTKEKEDAKLILLEREFMNGGWIYEAENRERLGREWAEKYKMEYDNRKASFEYSIVLLKTVFHDCPDQIIAKYTDCMNTWLSDCHWYFDKDKMLFELGRSK